MTERTPKTDAIYLRVRADTKKQFLETANRYGAPSEILRELIIAFIEGRVTIAPPANPKENLYVTRNED